VHADKIIEMARGAIDVTLLGVTRKHDVINETGSSLRHSGAHLSAATCRTTRATAADNANGKYATLSTRVSEICAQTDRQTDTLIAISVRGSLKLIAEMY